MELIRCFSCVALEHEVKRALERFVAELRRIAPSLKWAPVPSLHITLKFCGEIPVDSVAALSERYASALSNFPGFRVSLEGLGCFPGLRNPSVIWVGIREGKKELASLFERIERESVAVGVPPERRSFSPHLTLARARFPEDVPVDLIGRIRDGTTPSFVVNVTETIFMKSVLTPSGPIYSPIQAYPFSGETAT
jgi:2'-5' RNA ligase